MLRSALLACLSPLIVSATGSNIAAWRHPEVVQIMCDKVAGSAFRVGPSTFLSVAHVTHNSGCKINGRPFKEIAQSGDFVVLSYDVDDRHWFKVNCGGYQKGHSYIGLGFAHALDTQTEVDMTAIGEKDGRLSLLLAVFTVVPGMSGGPILDADTGEVVGTVNTFDPETGVSGSMELKSTPVCAHA
jgi:hypothetical protein